MHIHAHFFILISSTWRFLPYSVLDLPVLSDISGLPYLQHQGEVLSLRDHHKRILRPILGLGRDRYVFAVYHPCWLVTTPGVLISGHIRIGMIFSGRKGGYLSHCGKRPGPNLPRKSPISMARADSPRAARRACSAHTPSPRLAPAPAAPHWSLAAASTRDGSATCSITPMRPPEPHPERPGVGCSQQQESQRDGPSSATDWLHPPLAVHMQS